MKISVLFGLNTVYFFVRELRHNLALEVQIVLKMSDSFNALMKVLKC